MLLLIGWLIVSGAMLGGFMFSGGQPGTLFVTGEYTSIIGMFSRVYCRLLQRRGAQDDGQVGPHGGEGLALHAEALH